MQRTEAHERDRQRLRRVLHRAKDIKRLFMAELAMWTEKARASSAAVLELSYTLSRKRRWSSAWKAAAKIQRGFHHQWKQIAHNDKAERDELRKNGTLTWARMQTAEKERDELRRRLEEARPLLVELRDKSYDSGWLACKIELRTCEEPTGRQEFAQQALIGRRDAVFSKLDAALREEE